MESEKKINERINKMEEMIKRDHKMKDLMDYQSLSLFLDVRLPLKFKMPTLDKFDETGKQLKLETLGVEVEYKILYTCFSSLV